MVTWLTSHGLKRRNWSYLAGRQKAIFLGGEGLKVLENEEKTYSDQRVSK